MILKKENGVIKEETDYLTQIETHELAYFGCKINVWKIKGPYWGAFPWRFSVTELDGKTHSFTGVPNYLKTKRQALKKAWYRAKWLTSGEWSKHYKPI